MNKELKNLSLEEAISLFRGQGEIPLYEQLLKTISLTIGKPKQIFEDYTVVRADRNNVILSNLSTTLTVNIPLNAPFDDLDYIDFEKTGAGNLTISVASGVTINGTDGGSITISDTTGGVRVRKIVDNTYKVIGSFV